MAKTLADVDPIKSPSINPNYPNTPEWAENELRQSAVVNAWCGAAYDEASDNMWLGLGGGHRDYAGNEIYRCNFLSNSPSWQMVRAPSGALGNLLATNDGKEGSGVYGDGRPRACHSYNNWVYVPNSGPVLAAHAAQSWSAGPGTIAKKWSVWIDPNNGEHKFGPEAAGLSADNVLAAGACFDSKRKAIWLKQKSANSMFRYTLPAAGAAHQGSWTNVGADFGSGVSVSMCYLPVHDCILVGIDVTYTAGDESWAVFDCATGTWFTPTFSGKMAGGLRPGSSQPRWVAALGAVCVWDNYSETTKITRLAPGADPRRDAWTVSTLPLSATNAVTPSAKTAAGTFGRFAYSPRLGGFLVFNSTSGPTYFYKL
jgi:hypothetical protein